MVCGSKPFSASLSRILSPFLGGTRKGPPEGYPAESPDRASVRTPPAFLILYMNSLTLAIAAAHNFPGFWKYCLQEKAVLGWKNFS